VCNQKFDATTNTVTAQQTRLLQLQGVQHPNPKKQFINNLIAQINAWTDRTTWHGCKQRH